MTGEECCVDENQVWEQTANSILQMLIGGSCGLGGLGMQMPKICFLPLGTSSQARYEYSITVGRGDGEGQREERRRHEGIQIHGGECQDAKS